MHKKFLTVLVSATLCLGFMSCSNDVSSPEAPAGDSILNLSSQGTYDGQMILEDGVLSHVEIEIIDREEMLDPEHLDCNFAVDCETGLEESDFYREPTGEVCIGYRTTICDWTGGNLAMAIALYLPNETSVLDYLLLTEDLYLGYFDPSPGTCYLLTAYVTYNIPPGVSGDFPIDWVAALNHGTECLPFVHFCGWPLATVPPVITVHL